MTNRRLGWGAMRIVSVVTLETSNVVRSDNTHTIEIDGVPGNSHNFRLTASGSSRPIVIPPHHAVSDRTRSANFVAGSRLSSPLRDWAAQSSAGKRQDEGVDAESRL